MYECKSYDELSKIVNDWINSDTDDSDTGTVHQSSKNKKYSSIDDAFADLIE